MKKYWFTVESQHQCPGLKIWMKYNPECNNRFLGWVEYSSYWKGFYLTTDDITYTPLHLAKDIEHYRGDKMARDNVRTKTLLLDKMKTSDKNPTMKKSSVQKDMGVKGAKSGTMPKSLKGSSSKKMGGTKGLKEGGYGKKSGKGMKDCY